MRFVLTLLIVLINAVHSVPAAAQGKELSISWLPYGELTANTPVSFVVHPFDRFPVKGSDADPGYSPYVGATATWIKRTELIWDFGDGIKRTSFYGMTATHRYRKPGSYTIRVTAKHSDTQFSTGKLVVQIKDVGRLYMTIGAIAAPQKPASIQFSASRYVNPIPSDSQLDYEWGFGDGNSQTGIDLWNPVHRYEKPGRYQVTMTATDAAGQSKTRKRKIRVEGAGDETAQAPNPLEEKIDTKTVVSKFTANISGTVSGALQGKVTPIAQTAYYLVGKKRGCRLKLSIWDDQALAHGTITFRLSNPPVGGGRYQPKNTRIALKLYADPKRYQEARRTLTGRRGAVGSSPFGLQEGIAFSTHTGNARLDVVPGQYVVGNINATLLNYKRTAQGKVPTGLSISFQNAFSIKLGDLADVTNLIDGILPPTLLQHSEALKTLRKIKRGQPCGEDNFEIRSYSPREELGHIYANRRTVGVWFTEPIDSTTVSPETFQVGYPNAKGEFVSAKGRFLLNTRAIRFVPHDPLRAGIHYRIKVKTGPNGVKSLAGTELEDGDGSGWRESIFTTKVDVQLRANGSFGCNIYQSAQDVPLIVGKPAIARIHVRWQKMDDVHPSAQVKAFSARVKVGKHDEALSGSTVHRFVRPDLLEGTDLSKAEHTAQVPFIPTTRGSRELPFTLSVTPKDKQFGPEYWNACQYKEWDKKPKLAIDMYVLDLNQYLPPEEHLTGALINQFVQEVQTYAWQLFPVHRVEITLKTIPLPEPLPSPLKSCDVFCYMSGEVNLHHGITFIDENGVSQNAVKNVKQFVGYEQMLRKSGPADIRMVVGPMSLFSGAGGTFVRVDTAGFAVIGTALSKKNFSRNVNGAVHEIGHALGLRHIPTVDRQTRADVTRIREWTKGSNGALWFDGIEGFRMTRDGKTAWLKSSIEGNAEGRWLTPLMFPGTIDQHRAFISSWNYRNIQKKFDIRSFGAR